MNLDLSTSDAVQSMSPEERLVVGILQLALQDACFKPRTAGHEYDRRRTPLDPNSPESESYRRQLGARLWVMESRRFEKLLGLIGGDPEHVRSMLRDTQPWAMDWDGYLKGISNSAMEWAVAIDRPKRWI